MAGAAASVAGVGAAGVAGSTDGIAWLRDAVVMVATLEVIDEGDAHERRHR